MVMSTPVIIGAVVLIAVSILVILVVVMQTPKNSNGGLQALGGGSNYAASNDRSANAILNKFVGIMTALFIIVTLVVYILTKY